MTTKHTPGPWVRGGFEDTAGYDMMTGGIRIVAPNVPSHRPELFESKVVCVLDGADYGQDPSGVDTQFPARDLIEADAHLIAAAPDLLALAKQYASECGECNGTGAYEYDTANGRRAGQQCGQCMDIRAVIAKAEGQP